MFLFVANTYSQCFSLSSRTASLAYYYFCCLNIIVRNHRACCPSRRSALWVGSTVSHLVVCSCRFHIDDGQTGTFVHSLIIIVVGEGSAALVGSRCDRLLVCLSSTNADMPTTITFDVCQLGRRRSIVSLSFSLLTHRLFGACAQRTNGQPPPLSASSARIYVLLNVNTGSVLYVL